MRNKTIDKLNHIKGYKHHVDAYDELLNAAIDYDNEMQDNLYLYDTIPAYGFRDSELISYHIDCIGNDIDRLRFFINDTVGDKVYLINAYGNMENITMDDIIMCIDELLEKL